MPVSQSRSKAFIGTGPNLTQLSANNISSGTVPTANLPTIPVSKGGTNLTATPANGQIPIGNGSGYTLATLTAGTNITISNSAGGITINGSSGGVTSLNGQTGAITNTNLGAIGCYMTSNGFINGGGYVIGNTLAGSNINPSQSGTWRIMGIADITSTADYVNVSFLCVRIS